MNQFLATLQNTFTGIFNSIVGFTPSLINAIIIFVIGIVLSKLLRLVISKSLTKIKFDELVAKIGLADGLKQVDIKQTPSHLVATVVFWVVLLYFILSTFRQLGLNEAVRALENFIAFLPSIISSLIIFIGGALLAGFVGRTIQGALATMGIGIHQILGNGVKFFLLIVVAIVVMEQLGMDVTLLTNIVTNLITIVAAGVALAFGLGGRSIVQNVLAGHYARERFSPGDCIVIQEQEGTLERIGTINAEIKIGSSFLLIPNTKLTESPIFTRKPDAR